MPTLDTEQDAFTFDQLSDEAKDKARDWMRDCEMQDFDTEFMFESFQTAAGILGIEFNTTQGGTPDIRWSGFSSQGDGASFVGSYSHAPNSPAKIREEYPEETVLHAIADGLTALQVGNRLESGHWIDARITQDGRGVHEMTMSVEASDSFSGEEFDYDGHHVKTITEAMRDFARWMYKSLEMEYDYRQSDEYIDEMLSDGDYQFDEAGERL